MKETADVFADDISEDPGRDDGSDGDGDVAAELFGKSHADGRGDGLWKQRHVGSVVKAEGQAEDVDGKEPCHDAGKDTEEVLVCQTYVTPCLMKSWSVSFGDFHPSGRIGKQL